MDTLDRIVAGIIAVAFLSLLATFYFLEVQTVVPPYTQFLETLTEIAGSITIFLIVLGFAILLINRRMGSSGYY